MAASRTPFSELIDAQSVEQEISNNDLTFLEGSPISYITLRPGEAIDTDRLEEAQLNGIPIYIKRDNQWSVYAIQTIGNQYIPRWQEAPLPLTPEQHAEMSSLLERNKPGTIRNRHLPRPLIEALQAAHPEVESPIRDFMAQLERDYDRGYLKAENIQRINENMLLLIKAVRDLKAEEVQSRINAIDKELVYSRPVRTKWAAIGFAIGAFLEGVVMAGIAIATKGAAIPAMFMFLNIVSAGAMGAVWGYLAAQRQARQKFNGVANICNNRIWDNNRTLSSLAKKIGALYDPARTGSLHTEALRMEKIKEYLKEYRAQFPSADVKSSAFMEKLFAIKIPVQEPPSLFSRIVGQTFYQWVPLGEVDFMKQQKDAIMKINLEPESKLAEEKAVRVYPTLAVTG